MEMTKKQFEKWVKAQMEACRKLKTEAIKKQDEAEKERYWGMFFAYLSVLMALHDQFF